MRRARSTGSLKEFVINRRLNFALIPLMTKTMKKIELYEEEKKQRIYEQEEMR